MTMMTRLQGYEKTRNNVRECITTLQVKLAMPRVLHPRCALPFDAALRRHGSDPLGCALAHDRRPGVARLDPPARVPQVLP
jgi:hypothetical protein